MHQEEQTNRQTLAQMSRGTGPQRGSGAAPETAHEANAKLIMMAIGSKNRQNARCPNVYFYVFICGAMRKSLAQLEYGAPSMVNADTYRLVYNLTQFFVGPAKIQLQTLLKITKSTASTA
jgi:hypothetical protein